MDRKKLIITSILLIVSFLFLNSANAFYYPKKGRWINRDPSGEKGGINLYSYVQNDPFNLIDPLGLEGLDIEMAASYAGYTKDEITVLVEGPYITEYDGNSDYLDVYDRITGEYLGATPLCIEEAAIGPGDLIPGALLAKGFTKTTAKATFKKLKNLGKLKKLKNCKCLKEVDPKKIPRWKAGDDVFAPTRHGFPSDTTVRRRQWMNEAENPTRSDYTPEDFARMRKGKPPRRYNPDKPGMESMERSHEPIPKREGGTETVPRWPQEHSEVDPYRRPGY